jgi:hypothetical protein
MLDIPAINKLEALIRGSVAVRNTGRYSTGAQEDQGGNGIHVDGLA